MTTHFPSKSDPRWKALVTGSEPLKLKALATKVIITRVRLMGARKDHQSLTEAIETSTPISRRTTRP